MLAPNRRPIAARLFALCTVALGLSPAAAWGAESPIVRGLPRGLSGVVRLAEKHVARGDDVILLSPRGRLVLIPGEGRFLVSETRRGKSPRTRNFEYLVREGRVGLTSLEVMKGHHLQGARLYRDEALRGYVAHILSLSAAGRSGGAPVVAGRSGGGQH
jgi:hypothetical protein